MCTIYPHTSAMHKCLVNLPQVLDSGGKCAIFECLFGIKSLGVEIYFYVLKQDRTIKEIATKVKRDRTTALRLLQKLMNQNLILRKTEMLSQGGIRHIYSATPQESIKERLQETINEIEIAVEHLVKRDWKGLSD